MDQNKRKRKNADDAVADVGETTQSTTNDNEASGDGETEVKRGRGRPKKDVGGRGRGRPKKDAGVSTAASAPATAAKPAGQAKRGDAAEKEEKAEKDTNGGDSVDTNEPKRGRGRPKAVVTQDAGDSSAASAPATADKDTNGGDSMDTKEPKRGRGRPKAAVTKDAGDSSAASAPSTAAKPTGRGKRGAAAKKEEKADDDGADSMETNEESKGGPEEKEKEDQKDSTDKAADQPAVAPSPRKGRGRPKKSGAADADNDLDKDTASTDQPTDTAVAPAPRKGRGRPKKNAASDAADDLDKKSTDKDTASTDQPTDNAVAPAPGKGRGKPKKSAPAAAAAADDEADKKTGKNGSTSAGTSGKEMRTITIKGKAPVDQFCPIRDTAHVFCYGEDPFDVMLNQTNVQSNNNKYYVIQLLEDDVGKGFSVWQRWGRVGYDGQSNLAPYGPDIHAAQQAFYKKFHDKTGNEWLNRYNFSKHAGEYDLVKIDYSAKEEVKEEEKATEPKKKNSPPPSKLAQEIQDLLNLICDIRAMENAVKEMKYDASKAPLGKLTKEQIKEGYAALKDIEDCIQKNDLGSALVQACSTFYTRIPHYFGMKTPPLIKTMEELKQKLELLEALSDIEVALRTLAEGDKEPDNLHPIDKHYDAMKCMLNPLDHDSDMFKLLNKYLVTTHGFTHNMFNLELMDAFECDKDGEDMKFQDIGNKMLLWHGSRLTNWFGILSQGLRIAPPEAPVTGYMFGKGVYFADMSSKSANYCFTTREKNVGLLVLCEVSLGKTRDLYNADCNADKLPVGYKSTKGLGRTVPDEKEYVTLDNGVVVPCGKGMDGTAGATLQYNEYIVYETSQIKMKYLLKVKFNHKY